MAQSWSFVAKSSADATGANPAPALPTGWVPGNLLVIVATSTTAYSATPPAGWVNATLQTTSPMLSVWYKWASTGQTAPTLTNAATTSRAVMLCYAGAGARDVVGTIASGTSTAPATSSLTTHQTDDLIISAYAVTDAAANTWTAPGSTTSRDNSAATTSINGLLVVDEDQAAAGASTVRTATLSASQAWQAINIAFTANPLLAQQHPWDWDTSEYIDNDESSWCLDWSDPAFRANTGPKLYEDAWDWDEVAPGDIVDIGYQQSDNNRPLCVEDAWDWNEDVDADEWPDETLQSAVPAAIAFEHDWDWVEEIDPDDHHELEAARPTDNNRQLCVEDAWDWDEAAPGDFVDIGYQQSDNNRQLCVEDAWDWNEDVDADEWPDETPQSAVPAAIAFEHDWDWVEEIDPDDHHELEAARPTDNNRQLCVEDAWDWNEDVDADEWPDEPPQSAVPAAIAFEHDWDWVEEIDPDEYHDLEAARPTDNNRQLCVEDAWDWDEAAPGDFVDIGYQQSNTAVPPATTLCVEDAWDWDEAAPGDFVDLGYQQSDGAQVGGSGMLVETDLWDWDELGGEDGWANHYTAYDAPAIADLDWDWDEAVDDEWADEAALGANHAAASTALCVEDAWDWDEAAPGDFVDLGYQQSNGAQVGGSGMLVETDLWDWDELGGEDGWANHYTAYDAPAIADLDWDWDEAVDDEWADEAALGANHAAASTALCVEDAWDWDEAAPGDFVDLGYQQSNGAQVGGSGMLVETDLWDWDELGGEDGWANHYTAYDAPAIADLDWDWDEAADDDWADEATPPAAAAPQPRQQDLDWDGDEAADDDERWHLDDGSNVQNPTIIPNPQYFSEDCFSWDDDHSDDEMAAGYMSDNEAWITSSHPQTGGHIVEWLMLYRRRGRR